MHARWLKINRVSVPAEYKLNEIFCGIEDSRTLEKLFGGKEQVRRVLSHVRIRVERGGYGTWFERNTAKICINMKFLRNAKRDYIYLDIIHVLVHLKQFLDGKEADISTEYIDRPTEIEAYRYTIEEARMIGLTEKEILAYLRVETSDEEFMKLIDRIGIKVRT
jgi:hypothetical protein